MKIIFAIVLLAILVVSCQLMPTENWISNNTFSQNNTDPIIINMDIKNTGCYLRLFEINIEIKTLNNGIIKNYIIHDSISPFSENYHFIKQYIINVNNEKMIEHNICYAIYFN